MAGKLADTRSLLLLKLPNVVQFLWVNMRLDDVSHHAPQVSRGDRVKLDRSLTTGKPLPGARIRSFRGSCGKVQIGDLLGSNRRFDELELCAKSAQLLGNVAGSIPA